jgi:hypothetical protein
MATQTDDHHLLMISVTEIPRLPNDDPPEPDQNDHPEPPTNEPGVDESAGVLLGQPCNQDPPPMTVPPTLPLFAITDPQNPPSDLFLLGGRLEKVVKLRILIDSGQEEISLVTESRKNYAPGSTKMMLLTSSSPMEGPTKDFAPPNLPCVSAPIARSWTS